MNKNSSLKTDYYTKNTVYAPCADYAFALYFLIYKNNNRMLPGLNKQHTLRTPHRRNHSVILVITCKLL